MGLTSTFYIAQRGLSIAQAAIETVSHNIANVNTPGYSRQELNLVTSEAYPTRIGPLGTGVDAASITRYYDQFVERNLTEKGSSLAKYEAQKVSMDTLEALFNEANGNGINEALSDFWAAWEALADDPEGNAERMNLLEKAETLTNNINRLRQDMDALNSDINLQVEQSVLTANTLIKEIATLNEKIIAQEAGGLFQANDLRDARESRIKELAQILDIQYFEDPRNGAVSVVTPKGTPLVEDLSYWELKASADDITGNINIVWINSAGGETDITDNIENGSLGGWLELRDDVIQDFYYQFDAFTEGLITEVNRLHSQGAGLTSFTELTSAYDISQFAAYETEFTGSDNNIRFEALTEGVDGRDIQVSMVKGSPGDQLRVETSYDAYSDTYNIRVILPVNGNGDVTATAEDVVNLINETQDPTLPSPPPWPPTSLTAGNLIRASLAPGESGQGRVQELVNTADPTGHNSFRLDHSLEEMLYFGEEITDGQNTFDLVVYDQNGDPTIHQITVTPGDRIEDIIDQIGSDFGEGVDGVKAQLVEITGELRLQIISDNGYSFAFGNDDSNALMALGVNTFFSGTGNATIGINETIQNNISLIASGRVDEFGEMQAGDNVAALELADLKDAKFQIRDQLTTISESYNTLVSNIGATAYDITRSHDFNQSLYNDIQTQRDMVSAVNLDEEMANLIKFQYMYQAAAKLITTADEMLQTLLAIK